MERARPAWQRVPANFSAHESAAPARSRARKDQRMSSLHAAATSVPPDISPRKVALVAGLGLLLMAILAPIAQFGVFPSLIVPTDAATTVSNLTASNGL